MTLSALVLCMAVSLGNVELEPSTQATPELADDARVKRFIGAFTGGVVGLGAALALMPLGDGVGCGVGTCISPVHVLIGGLAPFFATTGAWLAFTLLGGDAGPLAPVIALAPALLVSLGLLAIARQAQASGVVSLMPYLISAGSFLAGGAALALDYRAGQLNELGSAAARGSASAGRVFLTSATGLAAIPIGIAAGYLYAATGSFAGILLTGLAGGIGVGFAAWGVHKALKGRGTLLSSFVGLGAGTAVSALGLTLYVLAQGGFSPMSLLRDSAALQLAVGLGAASVLFGPMLALEWSHTEAVGESLGKITFSAAPTPNGGMIGAGMRF